MPNERWDSSHNPRDGNHRHNLCRGCHAGHLRFRAARSRHQWTRIGTVQGYGRGAQVRRATKDVRHRPSAKHFRALVCGVDRSTRMFMITIFLLLLVSVFATVAYFTEPSETDKRTRERLVGLDRRSSTEDRQDDIVRQVTFSSVPSVDRFLRNNKFAIRLQLMLDQAKLPWTVGRFFFFSAVLMLIGAAIGNWWIPADFFGWLPGIALGAIPLSWVMYRRAGRFRRFNLMLPDAIDLMSRALRAGHALPSALSMVADEISDPLGPEFRRTADELNYGLPFREALLNLERRFPVRDLRFLVTAILVQKESGGNLITLLDKSAAVLRSRLHLAQKVRGFTAQGRLTGVILMALPFVCFIALNLVSPGYTKPLFENEIGRRMVYGTILSLAIGLFLIRRIIRIKV